MEGKYLITTDRWFYAPDGVLYMAVWGEVEILSDDILGVKTNEKSTNWYAKVGSETKHAIIAGCQIHYACRCEEKPNDGWIEETTFENGEAKITKKPSNIYIAE